MDALSTAFFWLDFAAVAVFGATGALAAARRKHDIITFCFFAAVTGVGGGTLRDLLIGAPVFWVARPGYVIACLVAAVAIWVVGRKPWRFTALLWMDALGMAAYTIVGTGKALTFGAPPLAAVVMGILTAAFGGVVRDVLAGEPSILLRREVYITASLAGATAFVALLGLSAPYVWAGLAGFAVALIIRSGALLFGWNMPAFPGTPTED